jgi:hypothetical protein
MQLCFCCVCVSCAVGLCLMLWGASHAVPWARPWLDELLLSWTLTRFVLRFGPIVACLHALSWVLATAHAQFRPTRVRRLFLTTALVVAFEAGTLVVPWLCGETGCGAVSSALSELSITHMLGRTREALIPSALCASATEWLRA